MPLWSGNCSKEGKERDWKDIAPAFEISDFEIAALFVQDLENIGAFQKGFPMLEFPNFVVPKAELKLAQPRLQAPRLF